MDDNEWWVGIRGEEDKKSEVEKENKAMNDVEDEKNLCDDDVRSLGSHNEKKKLIEISVDPHPIHRTDATRF